MASTKQRAAASGVSFSLGLMSCSVDMVPVKQPGTEKATQFSYICQDCITPTKPDQVYSCPNDPTHGPFTAADMVRRAKEVGGALIEVSLAERTAVATGSADKEDEPDEAKVMELAIVSAAQLESTTLPGDLSYRLRPGKTTKKGDLRVYALFVSMASDHDHALIGRTAIRGTTRLYRLQVWNGQLVAQSIHWPDDLAEPDPIDLPELKDTEKAMIPKLVASLDAAFDVEDYRNEAKARAQALVIAKAEDPDAVIIPMPTAPKPADDDLASLLEVMVGEAS